MAIPPTDRAVFNCQQCGDCCHGQGGILITPENLKEMAAFLTLPPEEFRARYTVPSPLGLQLATANGACIFLVGRRCRVHAVKPRICRQWPYLPALLAHADEFEQAKGACPGLDPQGRHADFVRAAASQSPGSQLLGPEAGDGSQATA
jgi:Fe-S-cluster containining protein